MGIRLLIAHYSPARYDRYARYFSEHPEYDVRVLPAVYNEAALLQNTDLRAAVDAVLVHEEMKGYEGATTVQALREFVQIPTVVVLTERSAHLTDLSQHGADMVTFEHYNETNFEEFADVFANKLLNLVAARSAKGAPPAAVEQAPSPVRETASSRPAAPTVVTAAPSAPEIAQWRGTFVVMGVAGGVGATTFAYHLSRVLADQSNQVCLLDARYPRSTLLDLLPIEEREKRLGSGRVTTLYTLGRARAARGDRRFSGLGELMRFQLSSSRKGSFSVIPSALSSDQLAELVAGDAYVDLVFDLCRQLERQFAFNIVLIGPDTNLATHQDALRSANRVILVTTQHAPHYARLLDLISALQSAPFDLSERNLDVVINRFDPQLPMRKSEYEMKRTRVRKIGEIREHRLVLERRAFESLNGRDSSEGRDFDDDLLDVARYFEEGAGAELPEEEDGRGLFPLFGRRKER